MNELQWKRTAGEERFEPLKECGMCYVKPRATRIAEWGLRLEDQIKGVIPDEGARNGSMTVRKTG